MKLEYDNKTVLFKHTYVLYIYLLEMSFLNVGTKEDKIWNVNYITITQTLFYSFRNFLQRHLQTTLKYILLLYSSDCTIDLKRYIIQFFH